MILVLAIMGAVIILGILAVLTLSDEDDAGPWGF